MASLSYKYLALALTCFSGLSFITSFCLAEEDIKIDTIPFALIADSQNGSITATKNQVYIVAGKGSDLFTNTTGSKNSTNTPKLLFVPEGDFIFSAKVSAPFTDNAYEGGALIIFSNALTWGKLLFEKFKSGDVGIATTVSDTKGDDAYHGTREGNEHYLKIVRHDNSYIFYTSTDGVKWNFIRHFELITPEPAQIGFTAQTPMGSDFKVTFSNIKYGAGTITDFWQGE